MKPINKQPHLRSKKPLKRIAITDLCKEISDNCGRNESFNTKQNEKEVRDNCANLNKYYSINSDDLKIIEKKDTNEENKHLKGSYNRQNDNCLSQKHVQQTNTEQHSSVRSDNLKNMENNHLKEEKNNSNSSLVAKYSDEKAIWEIPKTSVQFYFYWNKIKSTEEKYRFLKSINPQEFPKIFLNSMEPHVFSNILEVLADNCKENKDHVANILESLSNIKRFSTFIMFGTDTDRKSKLIVKDFFYSYSMVNVYVTYFSENDFK